MFIEAMFVFSFGGSDDFGNPYNIGEKFFLDFSPKPTGIGFAIRDGVDVDFGFENQIKLKISADKEIKATVEFKTVKSYGAPEKAENVTLDKGENEIIVDIPDLSSPLKEIVVFFPRNGREDSINISFLEVELLKKSRINYKTLNMNSYVKIKLTRFGIKRLKRNHEEMFRKHPSCKTKFIPPELDEEGFCRMQLWQVMKNFGDMCYIGSTELPFKMDIKIDEKDLKE